MKEADFDKLCELIQMQQDSIRDLRACHQALLMTLSELAKTSSPEAKSAILKYDDFKKKCIEDSLICLEKYDPERAAMLDIQRPLISPDDTV
jgi:hypothetical protein